jgi:glycosyltransferase involved in cell wall biosynthesis
VKISIVVPAFNEEKLLGKTLRGIRSAAEAFRTRGWDHEIIVCDNNSTDGTAQIARREGAQVVFEPVNQIARARNSGAAAATGDWLLFIDADSLPSSALLAEVADVIQRGGVLAGGATVKLDEFHLVGGCFVHFWNFVSRVRKWFAGSFIFCEAAAFREIGGFDPTIFASEELDLSKRLAVVARRQGKRLVILHRHPLKTSARKMRLYSTRDYLRLCWRVLRSRGQALKTRDGCQIWYDGRR